MKSVQLFATVILFTILLMPSSIGPVGSIQANQPPVAIGGNITQAEPDEKIFFSAAGSYDPDGTIDLYEWDFDGNGKYDWNSTENGTTEHVYHEEGAYNATLRVTDNNGTASTDIYYILILEEDKDGETDYDRIRSVLTVVGILEIVIGIGMTGFAIYLKRKLYDLL